MKTLPLIFLLASALILPAPAEPKPAPPKAGVAAPAWELKDVDGKPRKLGEFKERTIALYFFCGCRLCHKVAREWNSIQRGGALPKNADKAATPTVVIFHGDTAETKTFAEETLLGKDTVLLCDADEKVSETYNATLCPRSFVLDGAGIIRYTNDENGEDSYKIPAPLIVARTVSALRETVEKTSQGKK